MDARWATFDCYGTLIDWNAGIGGELERLFGPDVAPALLRRYHELEPEVQAGGYLSYKEVLSLTLERLAQDQSLAIPEGEEPALARSLPSWQPFPEVRASLEETRKHGWKLAILSNSDRDLIATSIEQIGAPFDHVVVAEDVGSYKPAHGHWERFFADTGADRDRHVHVGASLFHDIAAANVLGMPSIWINRLGERARAAADARAAGPRRPGRRAGRAGRVNVRRPTTADRLADDIELRPPRLDEAAAVAELANLIARRLWGTDDTTPGELVTDWTAPGVEVERDAVVAVLPGDRLVGYGAMYDVAREHTQFWQFVRIDSTYPGLAPALFRLLEDRVRGLALPGAVLRTSAAAHDDDRQALLTEELAYRRVRHAFRMEIDLDDKPPEPAWPDGIGVRQYESRP